MRKKNTKWKKYENTKNKSGVCNSWYIGKSMEIIMTKESLKQNHIMYQHLKKALKKTCFTPLNLQLLTLLPILISNVLSIILTLLYYSREKIKIDLFIDTFAVFQLLYSFLKKVSSFYNSFFIIEYSFHRCLPKLSLVIILKFYYWFLLNITISASVVHFLFHYLFLSIFMSFFHVNLILPR